MTTKPSRASVLRDLAEQRRSQAAAAREHHIALVTDLALKPEDTSLPAQIADVEAELSRLGAAASALYQAAAAAGETEAEEQRQAAIAASARLRDDVLAVVADRGKLAAAADRAGRAWIDALTALAEASAPAVAPAMTVVQIRHPEVHVRQGKAATVRSYVDLTDGAAAAAVVDVVRRAVEAIGGRSGRGMDDFLLLNKFASTEGATLERANATALEKLRGLL